ncbi:MAG: hypothetical protein ACRDL7_15925 [Gaiellaceae bacterium]
MKLFKGKERVLAISDKQIPFEHKDALEFVCAVRDAIEPTVTVNVGDEVDQMAMSRFDPDPEGDGPGVELRKALKHLRGWYAEFPEMLVCESNHTARVYKQAFLAGIPEAYLRTVPEWLDAPEGWVWANHWDIDGVRYEHGDAQGGQGAARNLAIRNRQSTVIGHHHSHGGVLYIANDDEMIFGMNVGCLIDMNSIAFRYAKMAANKPTLGVGIVIEGVPFFVPMLINGRGRWTGELVI